jgi:MinD-like ATPase involved in chromosome partitioning or flagellar assembly
MNKIVTIHSFRQSVGKSSLAANLAAILAVQGRRVALVDIDFQGASAHLFYRLNDVDTQGTFNDYMWKKCDILKTVHDVTDRLGAQTEGKLFLVPASTQVSDIMQMLRTTMNMERYTKGLGILEKKLALDIILVDTCAGLNENTLMSIAVSNTLILVLHPAPQDFQGTAVTVDVARKLPVPVIHLVLNDSSEALNVEEVSQQLEDTYHCGGGFVLNHSEELLALASSQPFVLAYPEHPLTARIKDLAQHL